MEDIRFRARHYNHKWYYGMATPTGNAVNLAAFFTNLYAGNFDIKSLGQFVGIYDINREPIYNGDLIQIISDKMSVIETSKRIVQVIYDRTTASFGLWGIRTNDDRQKVGFISFYYLFGKTTLPNMTIVGNVTETPKRWQFGK